MFQARPTVNAHEKHIKGARDQHRSEPPSLSLSIISSNYLHPSGVSCRVALLPEIVLCSLFLLTPFPYLCLPPGEVA